MAQQGDRSWSPLGFVVRALKMFIGIPDRSRWAVPDNSWAESGLPAEALVVDARRLNRTLSDPPSHYRWIVELRVRPANEAEFEVSTEDWFRVRQPPAIGDILHVVYDPSSHDRTIVDHRSASDREAGVGTAGPANDDNVLADAKWAETAGPGEVLAGTVRAFRRKARDTREANQPPEANS
jgi:hypothetical protein